MNNKIMASCTPTTGALPTPLSTPEDVPKPSSSANNKRKESQDPYHQARSVTRKTCRSRYQPYSYCSCHCWSCGDYHRCDQEVLRIHQKNGSSQGPSKPLASSSNLTKIWGILAPSVSFLSVVHSRGGKGLILTDRKDIEVVIRKLGKTNRK